MKFSNLPQESLGAGSISTILPCYCEITCRATIVFPFLELLSFYMFVLLNFWFSNSENGTSALAESSSSLPALKVS